MNAILILAAGAIALLVLSGRAATMNKNDWMALGLALIAANFARGGNGWMAGVFAVTAAWLTIVYGSKNIAAHSADNLKAARNLLGVSKSSSKNIINAAWREQLAMAHPDRGGDEQSAQRINQARDILIADLENRPLSKRKTY